MAIKPARFSSVSHFSKRDRGVAGSGCMVWRATLNPTPKRGGRGGREELSNSACKLVSFSLFAAAPGVNHDAAAAVLRNAAPPPRSHRHRHRHRVIMQYVTPSGSPQKIYCSPIDKISLLAMHTRVDDSLVTTATGSLGPEAVNVLPLSTCVLDLW